ncbi:hypothetical protein J5U18_09545 [Sphingobacteriaceae bacterium WQ 2009]|uniref:Bacteriocin n=1 Tax=Rhinopithecimicrobium faecis TaxID=2820698 RepID=A0A8T4HCF5_9SPHI|nr:hypothetical protein [Sphingobacteriaceae bacterium WQ 2009]
MNNIDNNQFILLSENELINIDAGGFWGDVGYVVGYIAGKFAKAQELELDGIGGPTARHT